MEIAPSYMTLTQGSLFVLKPYFVVFFLAKLIFSEKANIVHVCSRYVLRYISRFLFDYEFVRVLSRQKTQVPGAFL